MYLPQNMFEIPYFLQRLIKMIFLSYEHTKRQRQRGVKRQHQWQRQGLIGIHLPLHLLLQNQSQTHS